MKRNKIDIDIQISDKIKDRFFRILEQDIKDVNGIELTPGGLLQIIESDPSKRGKYLRWLTDIYRKTDSNIFYEDLYKIKETIELFEKIKSKLPNDEKNILGYSSYQELWNNIKKYKEDDDFLLSKNQLRGDTIVNDEYDLLLENDLYKVIVVKTHRSSCYWGSGTRWCTAVSTNKRTYLNYAEKGPLCIIYYKDGDYKKNIQFHIETAQYMDYDDNPIPPEKLFSTYTDVLEAFIEYIKSNKYKYYEPKGLKFYQDNFLQTLEKGNTIMSRIFEAYGGSVNGINDGCINSIPICSAIYIPDEKKSLKKIKLYLKHGASLNIPNKSTTLAHIIASTGRVDILKLLLKHGITLNIKDIFGRTPLHIAISNRHIDMARELILQGLNPNEKDNSGKTPNDLVKELKDNKTI